MENKGHGGKIFLTGITLGAIAMHLFDNRKLISKIRKSVKKEFESENTAEDLKKFSTKFKRSMKVTTEFIFNRSQYRDAVVEYEVEGEEKKDSTS